MIKRVLLGLLALLLLLVAVLVVNTLRQGSRQLPCRRCRRWRWTKRRRRAPWRRRCGQTVSGLLDPAATRPSSTSCMRCCSSATRKLHATLQARGGRRPQPALHLAGQRPRRKPMVLMAHQDVVPVAPGTEALWKKPPVCRVVEATASSGAAARWDDKGNLIAQMEALEMLVGRLQAAPHGLPGAGHDEEVGGQRGAVSHRRAAQAARRQARLRASTKACRHRGHHAGRGASRRR
jgi:carboxypeptidase PM20D1